MSAGAHTPGIVLISGYDPEYAVRTERTLAEAGFSVTNVNSLREIADQVIGSSEVALIVLTGGLSEPTTRAFLKTLEDASVPVAVLALVESAEIDLIESLRRMGTDDVLVKPFDTNELQLVARRLLLREELIEKTHIIGRSDEMKQVLERVAQYAPVNSTVLIEGESGTGKELIARAIHDLSPRRGQPFIAVNCAALPESLLESELFGHEKGAFTGATSLRKGRFELADRGTLFLDEVGEMPMSTQVKLLRVLEEREFIRVGGAEPIRVDVRLIAATNRDLDAAVDSGDFRRDLFYRLNVLLIRMPPLRERRVDIPPLIHHFVQEFCRENDRQFVGIDDQAMAILQNYDWPGNVRELRNLVESMLVLTPGSEIQAKDIPEEIYSRANPERLLPVALANEPEGGNRRIETLLGYFYRDLKGELDSLRRENAEIRRLVTAPPSPVAVIDAIEIEPAEEPERIVHPRTTTVETTVESEAVSPDDFKVGMSLKDLERIAIERTLDLVAGNRRKAAEILGIGERTLYRKLSEYDLS